MQKVVLILNNIISPEQNDAIVYNVIEEKELEKYKSTPNSNIKTIEIYNDLINDMSSLNIDEGTSLQNHTNSMDIIEFNSSSNVNEKEELEKYKPTPNSSKINHMSDLPLIDIDEYESRTSLQNCIMDIMESDNSSSSAPNQATKLSIGTCVYVNELLLKLEEDGFITPDEKVKELIKELTETKFL